MKDDFGVVGKRAGLRKAIYPKTGIVFYLTQKMGCFAHLVCEFAQKRPLDFC
jgi:hypothetical protein